jgi:hypothetical protein
MSLHNQCLPFEKSHERKILLYASQYFHQQHVFILKSHLEDTTSLLFGLGTISHTSLFIKDWYSSVMASAHSFFRMVFSKQITHQSHIAGEWLRSLHLSRGSFGNTILLSILNKLLSPSKLSLMGDRHLRRFLKFYYVMIF